MKLNLLTSAALTLLISNFALASGAVDYSCAGYIPSHGEGIGLAKASVVFHFLSAPSGESAVDILSRSDRDHRARPVSLDIDGKDCDMTVVPDGKLPAYRVTIKGTCGTKETQDIVGICFFD